jgi:hypothetical protein
MTASVDGNTRRATDFREGEKMDEEASRTPVGGAVSLSESKAKR